MTITKSKHAGNKWFIPEMIYHLPNWKTQQSHTRSEPESKIETWSINLIINHIVLAYISLPDLSIFWTRGHVTDLPPPDANWLINQILCFIWNWVVDLPNGKPELWAWDRIIYSKMFRQTLGFLEFIAITHEHFDKQSLGLHVKSRHYVFNPIRTLHDSNHIL